MTATQFLYWLPMIGIAFINGGFREFVLKKNLKELTAHQFSTIILILFCFVYVYLIFDKLGIKNMQQALLIGSIWMLMTIIFECCMGWMSGKSFSAILYDYNLAEGRIWSLFLMALAVMPFLVYRLKLS